MLKKKSVLLFHRIINAFLYYLYHQIPHKLQFPCYTQYIYEHINAIRVIKSMSEHEPRSLIYP